LRKHVSRGTLNLHPSVFAIDMSNFDHAFMIVIGHEGGYVDNPADPGGETKYGVSKRSYPDVDIKKLTLDGAKSIYKEDYWDRVRGDELPSPIGLSLFDAAVNAGVKQATKWLQRALKCPDDGIIGPQTINAAQKLNAYKIVAIFNGLRLKAACDLRTFDNFGKGWSRRIAQNLIDL
jgi:lysozyme family protein